MLMLLLLLLLLIERMMMMLRKMLLHGSVCGCRGGGGLGDGRVWSVIAAAQESDIVIITVVIYALWSDGVGWWL